MEQIHNHYSGPITVQGANYQSHYVRIKYTIIIQDRLRFREQIIKVITYPQRNPMRSMPSYGKDR